MRCAMCVLAITPRNARRALTLVDVVADSRYKIYEDFSDSTGWRLGDYPEHVHGEEHILFCTWRWGYELVR